MAGLKIFGPSEYRKRKNVKCGPPFRRGTLRDSQPVNFVLFAGGIGDFVNYLSAIYWIAETQKHVDGFVWAHPPLLEVCRYLFKKYPGWRVHDRKDFTKYCVEGSLIVAPQKGHQYLNATGAHLLDLGFNYYAQLQHPPEGWGYLPVIDYSGPWKWPEVKQAGKYAVFTPGATTDIRTMPAEPFNELVSYTISLGITPVFLGKRVVTESTEAARADYTAKFHEDYDFSKGVDLREKTTLLEAVQVMRGAEFVLGLDNGLLHFAGTTNVPIIFGHNITTIAHRQVKRRAGITMDITLSEQALECIGCQSKMRFTNHAFNKCIYGDALCLKMLFNNKCETWKHAINKIMEVRSAHG